MLRFINGVPAADGGGLAQVLPEMLCTIEHNPNIATSKPSIHACYAAMNWTKKLFDDARVTHALTV